MNKELKQDEIMKRFIENAKQQETLEEHFLEKIKEVLVFKNDAQAERFLEKYYESKKEINYEKHTRITNITTK